MLIEGVVRSVVVTVIDSVIAAIELEPLRSIDFDFGDSVVFVLTLIIVGFTVMAEIKFF